MGDNTRSKRRHTRWMRLALIVLVCATFAPLPRAEFVRWDDRYTLLLNRRLNPPTWENVASYWREWRRGEFGLYVPVTQTVWSGLAAVGRVEQAEGESLNPAVFHTANVIVHLVATLIVFQLALRLTRNDWAAAVGAAVFAVHPLQVEPVAWASGMKDVLGGMFSVAAVWLYARSAGGGSRARWSYAGAIAAAALAMLAKPSSVVVGPICFAVDVGFLRRGWRDALRGVWPMLVIAAPVALVARHVQDVSVVTPVEWWKRPVVAADAIVFYLRKLVVPVSLGIDYGRTPQVVLARPVTYALALVPVAIAVVLWLVRRRMREVVAAAAIFVIALSPVLGLTPFQFQQFSTVADHYLYLAIPGPALVVAWIVARRPTRSVIVTASAVVLVLAGMSFAQARYWRDDFTLFTRAIEVNPRSAGAHHNLANAHEAAAAREQGLRRDEHLKRAAELRAIKERLTSPAGALSQ